MTTPATNSTLYSLGLLTTTLEYTSGSGAIDLPTGARYVSFEIIGGGGGGGSPSSNGQDSGAGGNGAGGYIQVTFYY